MTLLEQIELLKRMDSLIRRQATGTPVELADKLGISRTSVFRYIRDLEKLGAPIAYNRSKRRYYYTEEFVLVF